MAEVTFTDQNHEYKQGGKKLVSATTLISNFKPKFDTEHWSLYKAAQKLMGPREMREILDGNAPASKKVPGLIRNYFARMGMKNLLFKAQDRIKEDWADENLRSRIKGTKYHNEREDKSYSQGTEKNYFDGKQYRTVYKKRTGGNASISSDLWDLEDGFYPELLLWNEEYGIAGQADKVYIETKKYRHIDIDDYKTNKVIKTESYFNKKTNEYSMMLKPLDHLMDCNYVTYALQLSLYAWMLEQFGFRVRTLGFYHSMEKHQYRVKYMKTDIQRMLFSARKMGILR